ncbi:hypothetical protein [Gulosibacter molinativorax]|uniref:hypothetical protein n=1 Tax=Gulosibacter molinativorax TaxID=256821 RepID=UPI0011B1F018|nr:hypothetical protein [Gulosibacter molinativorax]
MIELNLTLQISRRLGAVTLLASGLVHLKEYFDGYAELPVIGLLFLLNFLGAVVLAVVLLLPTERILHRYGTILVTLSAIAGIGMSLMSLVMLAIAERQPVFGFMEPGFHPGMILLARITEVLTVVLLGAFLITLLVRHRRRINGRGTHVETA